MENTDNHTDQHAMLNMIQQNKIVQAKQQNTQLDSFQKNRQSNNLVYEKNPLFITQKQQYNESLLSSNNNRKRSLTFSFSQEKILKQQCQNDIEEMKQATIKNRPELLDLISPLNYYFHKQEIQNLGIMPIQLIKQHSPQNPENIIAKQNKKKRDENNKQIFQKIQQIIKNPNFNQPQQKQIFLNTFNNNMNSYVNNSPLNLSNIKPLKPLDFDTKSKIQNIQQKINLLDKQQINKPQLINNDNQQIKSNPANPKQQIEIRFCNSAKSHRFNDSIQLQNIFLTPNSQTPNIYTPNTSSLKRLQKLKNEQLDPESNLKWNQVQNDRHILKRQIKRKDYFQSPIYNNKRNKTVENEYTTKSNEISFESNIYPIPIKINLNIPLLDKNTKQKEQIYQDQQRNIQGYKINNKKYNQIRNQEVDISPIKLELSQIYFNKQFQYLSNKSKVQNLQFNFCKSNQIKRTRINNEKNKNDDKETIFTSDKFNQNFKDNHYNLESQQTKYFQHQFDKKKNIHTLNDPTIILQKDQKIEKQKKQIFNENENELNLCNSNLKRDDIQVLNKDQCIKCYGRYRIKNRSLDMNTRRHKYQNIIFDDSQQSNQPSSNLFISEILEQSNSNRKQVFANYQINDDSYFDFHQNEQNKQFNVKNNQIQLI